MRWPLCRMFRPAQARCTRLLQCAQSGHEVMATPTTVPWPSAASRPWPGEPYNTGGTGRHGKLLFDATGAGAATRTLLGTERGTAHCGSPGRECMALTTVAGRSPSCDAWRYGHRRRSACLGCCAPDDAWWREVHVRVRIAVPGYDADDRYVGPVDFDHDAASSSSCPTPT